MRVSSVILPCSIGTLKSTRTNTRRPASERSRMVRILVPYLRLELFTGHEAEQVDATAGVAPLVVVPGHDLHEIRSHHLCIRHIEHRGMGISTEIYRDERRRDVFQDALE